MGLHQKESADAGAAIIARIRWFERMCSIDRLNAPNSFLVTYFFAQGADREALAIRHSQHLSIEFLDEEGYVGKPLSNAKMRHV
jgi:hypothetical protein